jgi:hypothetical protein
MNPTKHDPLLLAAQALLWFFIAVMGFALIFVAIGTPAVAIFQDKIIAEAAAEGVTAGPELIGALVVILAAITALLALAIYFFVLLLRMIESVKAGDPFIEANAKRLWLMGWIALAGQLLMLPIAGLAMWIEEVIGDARSAEVEGSIGMNGEGLLLVLVLFILARVFRQGAAMRADLEGTV